MKPIDRRRVLRLALMLPFIGACTNRGKKPRSIASPPPSPTPGSSITLVPTPSCDDGDDQTPEQTEGPFYTPKTPERASLREAGISGSPLVVEGDVVDTNCNPVAGALLDFWHADDDGNYDNEGFRLRGHQFANSAGRYRLETIMPGLYTGRTRHIHVKVQAPNRPVLTTQLYFPGEASNPRDGIFDDALVVQKSGSKATFTFVLDLR